MLEIEYLSHVKQQYLLRSGKILNKENTKRYKIHEASTSLFVLYLAADA